MYGHMSDSPGFRLHYIDIMAEAIAEKAQETGRRLPSSFSQDHDQRTGEV